MFDKDSKKDLPMGLAMALAQNKQALFYYSTLDSKQQKEIENRAKSVKSKEEMAQFVSGLAQNKSF